VEEGEEEMVRAFVVLAVVEGSAVLVAILPERRY
jgi:hypothetical protein